MSVESQKMDILLSMKKKGYNLKDTEDPAVLSMDLGNGYSLLASVKREWLISFNDGVQTTEYQIDSVKVPFTNSKDAHKLYKEYCEALKAALDEVEEHHENPVELPPEVPEALISPEAEDAQKASEEADKLAKLEAIMNGEAEPETKPVTRVQKTVRHEKPVQRMPAVIPISMRDIQIKELSIDDIKQYICPAATDQEAFMFLKLCQARQLNPFLNEAYLIKYGDKATMTVGKEAFMRRAEAHPQFDGYEAGIIIQNADKTLERREGTFILKNEVLVGGWAKIYRKDRRQPFVSEVALHEYNTGKSLWVSKPATMIRKVAIVQGKREAFPSEFSGMYDSAEMGIDNPEMIIDARYQAVDIQEVTNGV